MKTKNPLTIDFLKNEININNNLRNGIKIIDKLSVEKEMFSIKDDALNDKNKDDGNLIV